MAPTDMSGFVIYMPTRAHGVIVIVDMAMLPADVDTPSPAFQFLHQGRRPKMRLIEADWLDLV